MSIALVISGCHEAGIQLNINNDQLVVKGKKESVTQHLPLLQRHKEDIKHYLSSVHLSNYDNNYTNLDERMAIIQHESGIPLDWARAFAYLSCIQRPKSISQNTWQHIVNNTGLLLDHFIHDIIQFNWTIEDIFGVHSSSPEKRYDCMGLLMLLGKSKVTAVNSDKITTLHNKQEHGFYRIRVSNSKEQIMIWEL